MLFQEHYSQIIFTLFRLIFHNYEGHIYSEDWGLLYVLITDLSPLHLAIYGLNEGII